jgi:hypothetical protein
MGLLPGKVVETVPGYKIDASAALRHAPPASAVIGVACRQHRALVPEVEAFSGGQRAPGGWRHYPRNLT